ncbi:major capsid protein [Enterobacter mori]|uniref:major capsid protein n=1 Tax=Enterobacter mori TaxID=539813 RepID=UPI0030192892
MRNLNRPYSDAAGFKEGTVLEYILRYGRIESFNQTFKLTGNPLHPQRSHLHRQHGPLST